MSTRAIANDRGLHLARVLHNKPICRDHYRLILAIDGFPSARPGQFVHLACDCPTDQTPRPRIHESSDRPGPQTIGDQSLRAPHPYIRRAFSIAALQHKGRLAHLSVIYRVVGVGTKWLAELNVGHQISVLGPLGNTFQWDNTRPIAYLVAGGVGLPPIVWLAQALGDAGKQAIAFSGSVTRDLLPLTFDGQDLQPVSTDAATPTLCTAEFRQSHTPLLITTDDGSIGLKGFVTDALRLYHEQAGHSPDDITVYACGPEPMLKTLADFCRAAAIPGQFCMERSMACGMGTCQSCVVPIRDPAAADGWTYRLCCTDGPVFPADEIIW